LTADERLKLIKALVKRIEDSNSDQPLYQLSGENTIQLYMFWAANKEVAGVTSEEAFGRALVNNSNEALAIIKCFMTESVSSTEGRQKMFSRDNYRALSSVVRPDIIVEHLGNNYVKSLDVQLTGNNDRAYPKTDAELVRFFYYLWDTEPQLL
jgi:hypothetical protein